MSKAERLRALFEANVACGDISGAGEMFMLAEIAAAKDEEDFDSSQHTQNLTRNAP